MQFLDPQKVIQHFSIEPGMQVAEFYAGSGHFTPLLETAVGPYGMVHSFQNDGLQLDRVVIICPPTLSHNVFGRAYQLLKPAGKIILIHHREGDISPEHATDLAGIAGFFREKHFNTGDYHFGLVFKKG